MKINAEHYGASVSEVADCTANSRLYSSQDRRTLCTDKRRLDRERCLTVASVGENWDRERCLALAWSPFAAQLSVSLKFSVHWNCVRESALLKRRRKLRKPLESPKNILRGRVPFPRVGRC